MIEQNFYTGTNGRHRIQQEQAAAIKYVRSSGIEVCTLYETWTKPSQEEIYTKNPAAYFKAYCGTKCMCAESVQPQPHLLTSFNN